MSTFRLEPEHYLSQLARSTFCQRPNRFPPERSAFSPYESHVTDGNPYVLETFQPYRVASRSVNRLESQDFHLIFTKGTLPPGPWVRATRLRFSRLQRHGKSARAEAEDGQIIKDRMEVLLFAKPFREPCPRMRTPDLESNWRLANWMPQAIARVRQT